MEEKPIGITTKFVGPPAPAPPNVPNKAALQPTASVAAPVQLSIRTMADDLLDIKQGGKRPVVTPPPSASGVFPLPPVNKNQRVVLSPEPPRHPLPWGRVALVGGVVVLLLAVGVGVWWVINQRGLLFPGGAVATPEQVLPAQHSLVVAYPVLNAEAKAQLQAAWGASAEAASVATLLKGDPRLLLPDDSNFPFFFVLLPGEVRPYVIAPQNTATSGLLAGTHDGQVVEYQGWYIAHALDTKPYLTALSQGTAAAAIVQHLVAAPADRSLMRWWLASDTFQQLRIAAGGRPWAKAPLHEALLGFSSGGDKSLTINGQTTDLSVGTQAYQSALLNLLPGDATVVQSGDNLKAALEAWRAAGAPLPAERLDRPVVKQLVDQLTVPYAFYYRLGADAVPDVGLVADLTSVSTVVPTSLLGDPGVETALPAWLNLLLENPPTVDLLFTQRTYNDTTLKYVNVQGPELALDYAVVGNYLVAASSREGMLKLLDVISQREALDPSQGWRALLAAWGTVPSGSSLSIATFTYPPVRALLPPGSEVVTVGMTMTGRESGGSTISGRVQY